MRCFRGWHRHNLAIAIQLLILENRMKFSSIYKRLKASVLLMGTILVLTACGGGGGSTSSSSDSPTPLSNQTPTPTPIPTQSTTATFTLVASAPSSGSLVAKESDPIILEFSAAVAPEGVTAQSVRVTNRFGDVTSTLQVTAKTIRITPARRLIPKESYRITLSTGIGDSNGNQLKQPAAILFTTLGPSWQEPEFALNNVCGGFSYGRDDAVLLDDGTLLLSCQPVPGLGSGPTLQIRNPAGQWVTPFSPPQPVFAGQPPIIQKLSGSKALALWTPANFLLGPYSLALVFDTSTGWSAPLSPLIPQTYSGLGVSHDYKSLGTDGLVLRTRRLLPTELTSAEQFISGRYPPVMYELASITTGALVASFRSEVGFTGGPITSCRFPNGDRLLVHESRANTDPVLNLFDIRVKASLYKVGVGWLPVVEIARFLGRSSRFSTSLVCTVNGAARLSWEDANIATKYADWSEALGWQLPQGLSVLGGSDRLEFAIGDDGSALMTWNDYRADPNGLITVTNLSVQPNTEQRYTAINRLSDVGPGSSSWRQQLGFPLYGYVNSVAYNPLSKRFVTVTSAAGGSGGNYFSDYSRSEGWSSPWPVPLVQGADDFVPYKILFNASGKGLVIGRVNFQTYISELK